MPHTALDETMASPSESSDSLRLRVSKLGGEEQDVQVERSCSLEEFKSLLAGRGLVKEGLAVDFIVEGVLLNLSRSGATIGDLNLAEDCESMSLASPPSRHKPLLKRRWKTQSFNPLQDSHLVVITRRSHDYSQIREVQCMVKSHNWPQGVLTTTEGHLYVCHYSGQLQAGLVMKTITKLLRIIVDGRWANMGTVIMLSLQLTVRMMVLSRMKVKMVVAMMMMTMMAMMSVLTGGEGEGGE